MNKTIRKNNTKLSIIWPKNTEYFTIDTLIESNKHMLTASLSDITLRVRLKKAIEEEKIVSEIGYKNLGKGRPKLVFAMNPVLPSVLEKAEKDGITMKSPSSVPVINVNSQKPKFNSSINSVNTETVKV